MSTLPGPAGPESSGSLQPATAKATNPHNQIARFMSAPFPAVRAFLALDQEGMAAEPMKEKIQARPITQPIALQSQPFAAPDRIALDLRWIRIRGLPALLEIF